MRLALQETRINRAGAELAAVSVDDEERQAAMADRWALHGIRFVADPGGERHLGPLGLFDPDERGGIGLPGVVIITPDGREVYRYQGRDFADRTSDDDLLLALEGLGLPVVDPEPWNPPSTVDGDLAGCFRPENLPIYFRANLFAATAIGTRIGDGEGRAVADEHRDMARATLDAWEQWKHRIPSS